MRMHDELHDVQARTEEINGLAQGVTALRQMYQDMAIMVEGQSELINCVEHDVQGAHKNTEKTAKTLVEARNYLKSARRRKLQITLVVVTILLIFLAAILIPILLT